MQLPGVSKENYAGLFGMSIALTRPMNYSEAKKKTREESIYVFDKPIRRIAIVGTGVIGAERSTGQIEKVCA